MAADPQAKRPEDARTEGDAPGCAEGAERGKELATLADFAAGLAHEINNPLAIIIEAAGWVQDLLEDELKKSPNMEEMHRSLRQIATQAGRCRDITHNLLSFARRMPGRVEDVRLDDLIRDVVATLAKRASSRRVKIGLDLESGVPTLRLSPTEMQQVLINLINNALDAFEVKGGRVDVTLRLDRGEVLLDVADTGSGIPESTLARIFDPFFTTKPVGKGTGLGLSICYGIVKNLGGTIRVESKVGSGTTFHLRFPEKPAEGGSRHGGRTSFEEEDEGLSPAAQASAVVLIADNEEGLAQTLAKRRNFVVLSAASGRAAIAQVEADHGIDVVLLDVTMPDMVGAEVLREIKRRSPLVEVILLSSDTTVESAIDGMRLGAFDYLVKPCELGLLVAQICRARARKLRQEEKIMEARLREITMRRA